jgi:hypothetical protein
MAMLVRQLKLIAAFALGAGILGNQGVGGIERWRHQGSKQDKQGFSSKGCHDYFHSGLSAAPICGRPNTVSGKRIQT